jgi:DNA (cytosine-5)-methyltransferase 1
MKKKIVISTFSGAMGLDNGIEKAGLDIRLCVEFQHAMAETIRQNKPDIPVIEDDIRNYSGDDLRNRAGLTKRDDVFLVCGGPPCQAFSTAGKRLGFDDERGNVFLKYIDIIGEIRPKYFLLENVRGLLSASYTPQKDEKGRIGFALPTPKEEKGTALLYALEQIKRIGYSATFTLYDSANYGVPQRRERVIILGGRDGYQIPLIPPTHSETGTDGLKKWKTFRDAVKGLQSCTAGKLPEKRLQYFKMLKPGQYWKDLPPEIQPEAMGKAYELGGGKTGFYRRLAWDKPSPTLVTCPTMPATDLVHPIENRPLSIEEYARIQMFPDYWKFAGSLADIYKQIGNAVPVGMGYAAAKHLLWFDSLSSAQKRKLCVIDPNATYSRYKNTNHEFFAKLAKRNLLHAPQLTLGI